MTNKSLNQKKDWEQEVEKTIHRFQKERKVFFLLQILKLTLYMEWKKIHMNLAIQASTLT